MCMSVTSCCFCLSLDVGAKIVSVISVLSSCLVVVVYGAPAAAAELPESRRLVYALAAVCGLLELLISCALVYGIFKKNPRLLVPWLATAWVSCGMLLALSVLGSALVLLNYTRDPDVGAEISSMVSVYFLEGVVMYYFASVVSSRRQELLREDSTESAERLMRRYAGQKFGV